MSHLLLIAGADRSCDTAAAIITVGRRSVKDAGLPGYLRSDVGTGSAGELVTVPQPLAATADTGVPRFAGRVADADITHDAPGRAWQRITAMGPLSAWGRVYIGDEPWPAESVAARAARIADLIGQPIIVQGGEDMTVIARDVDRRQASELLDELADSTGGWLFDHAGAVYLQALDYRRVNVTTAAWDQEPAVDAWDMLDPAGTWADDDEPAAMAPILLECGDIDWEPAWSINDETTNVVEVEYGPPTGEFGERESVTVQDAEAVAADGYRYMRLDSQLQEAGDAMTLAGTVLARAARPQWALARVRIPWDALPPDTAARLDAALPGTRVTVQGLPQPAPAHAFSGVLEGWTETLTGDGREWVAWLSHVSHSLAVPTWDAEPAGESWDMLDPSLTWENDL